MPTGSSGSPVTLSFTVELLDRRGCQNKDQAFVLLSYLAGVDGMTKWTAGRRRAAVPKDVPVPAGKDVLAQASAYAKPGSGFMPGYVGRAEGVPGRVHRPDPGQDLRRGPVVAATKAAIDKALEPVDRSTGGRRSIDALGATDGEPRMTLRAGARSAHRPEALAGYAMIAVPMLLFLVLQICPVFYALYISLWHWNVRPGRSSSWASTTTRTPCATRSSSERSRTRSTTRSSGCR